MNSLLLVGFLLAGSVGGHSDAASSAQVQNQRCPLGEFIDVTDTRRIDVVEVVLSDPEIRTVLDNYTGSRQPDAVRVFTVLRGHRITAVVAFGRDGCFGFRIFRDLAWISGLLDRDITHSLTP